MTEAKSVAEVLAMLEPRKKPRSENQRKIEANLGAIYSAKDRGCTWAEIAEAPRRKKSRKKLLVARGTRNRERNSTREGKCFRP